VAGEATGAFRCGNDPEMPAGEITPLGWNAEMALDEAGRVRLGAQPDTTPDVLHALAADKSVTVRAALALNPSTPAQTNSVLACDEDERVRALLARKLSLLVPCLSAEAQTRLRRETLATLTALAEDEAVRVRAAIADAVQDLPDVPRGIILRLAHDDAISVCEPVIRFSPLLTADDLVALVAAAPSPGTRLAVARRPAIDAAVSDALAAGGTSDVVLALLMNGTAQIREATLDALVDRSADHPVWHDPLVHRPALSTRSVNTLSRIVTDHLLGVLAARSDLGPGVAENLRGLVAARLHPAPEAAEPDVSAAKPTEAELLAAAREGDAWNVAVLLAAAADVPLTAVRGAASLRNSKALVSLAWKAGFSMQAAHAVQVLLARLPPGSALRAGPGNSFPLSEREMSWQVDFLNGKER
jgi:Uncharacterised protein conserved in bacteria (DUF2336)